MANTPRKIIVHHTASINPEAQFSLVDGWHKDREFLLSSLGFYVGYHYFIEKDGNLRTAKRETEVGCHTIGQNESSIGVCLAGNFDVEDPTPEQIATLGDLLTSLCSRYLFTEDDIYPHRAFSNTHCFGSKLSAHWASKVYLEHEVKRFQLRLNALPTE